MQYLCSFLFRVSQFADLNKMNLFNLATCFATNILRAKEPDIESLVRDTPLVNEVTQLIIENHSAILKQKNFALPNSQPQAATPTPTPTPTPTQTNSLSNS